MLSISLTQKALLFQDELKWEACRYTCKHCVQEQASDGLATPTRESQCDCRSCFCEVVDEERLWECPPCGRNNRCYGSDRIRDLVVMRALLQDEKQLVPKDGQQAAWSVNKFDFTSWKRRGHTSGGPKAGTWPFRRGDKVTLMGEAGTFTVQRGDDEGTAGKLLIRSNGIDDSREVSRSLCDFAPGFDYEDADSEADRPQREPFDEDARKELQNWANGPITIAGNLFIAVPHAHSADGIARAVSEAATPEASPSPRQRAGASAMAQQLSREKHAGSGYE